MLPLHLAIVASCSASSPSISTPFMPASTACAAYFALVHYLIG
jgi:hypothetical protein